MVVNVKQTTAEKFEKKNQTRSLILNIYNEKEKNIYLQRLRSKKETKTSSYDCAQLIKKSNTCTRLRKTTENEHQNTFK